MLALYRKTYLDAFWRLENLIYSRTPEFVQRVIRTGYVAAFRLAIAVSGRSLKAYVSSYKSARDGLLQGGYPYESAGPAELNRDWLLLDLLWSASFLGLRISVFLDLVATNSSFGSVARFARGGDVFIR